MQTILVETVNANNELLAGLVKWVGDIRPSHDFAHNARHVNVSLKLDKLYHFHAVNVEVTDNDWEHLGPQGAPWYKATCQFTVDVDAEIKRASGKTINVSQTFTLTKEFRFQAIFSDDNTKIEYIGAIMSPQLNLYIPLEKNLAKKVKAA